MSLRRFLPLLLIIVSVLALTIVTGDTGSADDGPKPPPRAAPGEWPPIPGQEQPVAPPGTPEVVEWVAEVEITPELLRRMMNTELQANEGYFEHVRKSRGEQAALAEENAIRVPYLERIAEVEASVNTTESIPMSTIYDKWSFSKTSHSGPYFDPKDPVSILWYWHGTETAAANRMDDKHTCRPDLEECNHDPEYKSDGAGSTCSHSAQWVFMGNAGGSLNWEASFKGLQKEDDSCRWQPRDHIRFYGSVYHPTLKWWSVGSPHHETWSLFGGHDVDSWHSAQELFAGSWIESGAPNDPIGWDIGAFWWDFSYWGNSGYYQDVYFDGFGFVIGYDSLARQCPPVCWE
jgi:hypothetical protein